MQNVGISLAVTMLCICCVKKCFHVELNISICPFPYQGYVSQFWAILVFNGANDVFLQPLLPFEGLFNVAAHLGVSPQNHNFWL